MKETQGTYGDSVRQFSVKSGIPYSSLQNLLAGKGGLSFEDFLSLAGYARISPQGLMTAILPKPAGKPRPTVRALVAAEPILEQIEIAHEVLDRASQTIDRRPPQGT
jgi:predicted transcriptional regulator